MLQRGELEVALSEIRGFSEEVSLEGLTVEHLFDDPLCVSLPGGHPLATRDRCRSASCATRTGSCSRRAARAATPTSSCGVPRCGFEPRGAYFSMDYFAIQGLVATGMGVALVPGAGAGDAAAGRGRAAGRGQRAHRGIGAAFSGEPVGAAATMLDCLREASVPYRREQTVPV